MLIQVLICTCIAIAIHRAWRSGDPAAPAGAPGTCVAGRTHVSLLLLV